ncbi:hypothetical protein RSOL_185990 [Rhizoctonia solani AG-3 Rhs1AP]|uniref:Uncharacterized protein n=1 Tax=Rhizoctonia solani AG-3 Rhs1AP TaxID=1086054 RepID=X8J3U1_9AGAM|nr:hypothetical protein RSOL_185990 [Rhizoctonia solani AG-3 Rhs1AP]
MRPYHHMYVNSLWCFPMVLRPSLKTHCSSPMSRRSGA